MIGAILLFATALPLPTPRYEFCGVSADSADQMAQAVLSAPDLQEEVGTEQWRVRSNGHDIIWSVGLPDKGGPHAVVCRHIVPKGNGSTVDMEIACDGSDAICDKVRDDFVALNRRALSQ
jgi:hypothetical protein